ncbi:MAG: DUF2752 domain-containing protein [Bacteroidota bacterium]|nr:DUF2752 domain-containing protein [Bacteroidota bacterium]
MSRRQLYAFILIATGSGYSWLIYSYYSLGNNPKFGVSACIFKDITGIPCPSCGVTRTILTLSKGQVWEALQINPLGILLGVFLLLFPLWIGYDLIRRKSSFLHYYLNAEELLKKKIIAIPAVILILLNWIWNIYKHL